VQVAVVGHVEVVDFVRVARVPLPGEIVSATDAWRAAGGGGAVAAVQLAALAGGAVLFAALGDDPVGREAADELRGRGVDVEATWRPRPQRRAFTFVDDQGERTITLLTPKLHPHGDDPLPWERLDATDAVYFTAGDAGALVQARRARVLVATARELPTLKDAGVRLDALVHSRVDASERYLHGELDPPPRLAVATAGGEGGAYETDDGRSGRFAAAEVPGRVVDAYGAGDCFAAGLTFALGAGMEVEAALAFASRCGAGALTGRGVHAAPPSATS
jgi:ribokinase